MKSGDEVKHFGEDGVERTFICVWEENASIYIQG